MNTTVTATSAPRTARAALVLAVLAASVGIAVVDGEAGIRTWLELRSEARVARARVDALEREVGRLRSEVEAMRSDPLALERAIREDLELARPGEWVVRFAPDGFAPALAAPRDAIATSRFP